MPSGAEEPLPSHSCPPGHLQCLQKSSFQEVPLRRGELFETHTRLVGAGAAHTWAARGGEGYRREAVWEGSAQDTALMYTGLH